jgi:hypothetical protein
VRLIWGYLSKIHPSWVHPFVDILYVLVNDYLFVLMLRKLIVIENQSDEVNIPFKGKGEDHFLHA